MAKTPIDLAQARRAIDSLRRQSGIVIRDGARAIACLPIESLDKKTWAAFRTLPKLCAAITPARARSLGLKSSATPIDVSGFSLNQITALADPTFVIPTTRLRRSEAASASPRREAGILKRAKEDSRWSLPRATTRGGNDKNQELALILAKHASLLPAMLMIETNAKTEPFRSWVSVEAQAIRSWLRAPADVVETASARLPLDGAENARLVSFRQKQSGATHLALIVGDALAQKTPLVRVHSSCTTGDILGSLRCDCGGQLQLALSQIIAEGAGILVYLHQEGRGIGLTNKIRAYALQEQGFDTYEANRLLGFDEDERDFAIAAAILKTLGARRVRLLTNNPQKIAGLKKHGITVARRLPLIAKPGRHSHGYIAAKARKSGHLF